MTLGTQLPLILLTTFISSNQEATSIRISNLHLVVSGSLFGETPTKNYTIIRPQNKDKMQFGKDDKLSIVNKNCNEASGTSC